MTQQTKDEAREETLLRWRALPDHERQTIEQANVFAAALADDFDFRTMGNTRRIILGWLIRDLEGKPAWGNVPPESIASSAMQVTAVAEPETDGETDEMATLPLVEAELDDEIEQLADDVADAEDEREDPEEAAVVAPGEEPDSHVDAPEASEDDDLEHHRHAAE